MKYFALACVLMGVAVGVPGPRQRRDSSPQFFELPSDAELILGPVKTGFACADLPYGYYADEDNRCAVFHICLPYIDNGEIITRQFSFLCGEGTVFDQERLICDVPESSVACSESRNYRRANEYFGRDVNFLE
ncbi:U-scoloptoxin(01)-Er1a-like [Macrobrachium nipponense]|uniref:U-scoloptoxin(01)-Er1a-like n=1 Tax=Macrobrachium nipponense TaxID=159736 RepID=UPI0030C87348